MTKLISDYFQNDYNKPLEAAFGPQLNKLCYIDLSDLLHVVLEATADANLRGDSQLNMAESSVTISEAIDLSDDGVRQAIEVLEGFLADDALNLIRAIVDIMETAKVD